MTVLKQVYKCSVCGNIIEVLHAGVGELVCCGQPMNLLNEKTIDVGNEKHVPVIEKTANGFKVKIGSIPHPMEQEHYIEWVELIADSVVYRKHLKPGDAPEAEFCIKAQEITARETEQSEERVPKAREYCNIHGLWKS